MPSEPLVSVIINAHNGERYLRETIDTVYAQTYKNWEIVLWDDASTDGTESIARSYDARLRYFKGAKAIGLGQARNFAVEQAKGEFLAFLDQDDLWLPMKLQKQIPLFHDQKVGLVYSDAINFNESGMSKRVYGDAECCTGYCFPRLFRNYFLLIQTVVIRRSSLDSLDSWFEPGFSMTEESDLFMRIAYRWKMAMVQEPLAKGRLHSSSWTWKLHHRTADEFEATLFKYQRIYPDFNSKFPKEIEAFQVNTIVTRAKSYWISNKSMKARECLVPIVFSDPRVFAFFWLTYLPSEIVYSIVSKLRGTIYPVWH